MIMAGGNVTVWFTCMVCPKRIGPYQDSVQAGGRHYHLNCYLEKFMKFIREQRGEDNAYLSSSQTDVVSGRNPQCRAGVDSALPASTALGEAVREIISKTRQS